MHNLSHLTRATLVGLIVLGFTYPASAQNKIEGTSDAFHLVIPGENVVADPLVISTPEVRDGETLDTDERAITVRGSVGKVEDVVTLTVGGSAVAIGSDGAFESDFPVPYGEHEVLVRAEMSDGTAHEVGFTLKREDHVPPEIAITEPRTRGLRVVSKSGRTLRVRGRAADDAGVATVTVDGIAAELTAVGEFEVTVPVPVGSGEIVVVATDRSGLTTEKRLQIERDATVAVTGKFYAFIIGIDQYTGEWYSLENAVRDARGLANVLNERYQFDEIITLFDEEATRDRIIGELEQLAERVRPEDNVLIYYSGHGEFNERYDRGYWVPQDAVGRTTAQYISNTDLRTYINGIRSKHTLLIADACFAGDVFRAGRTGMIEFEESEAYYEKVFRRVSRKAITSGNVEPVMDGGRDGHSVFTYYLLKALKTNQKRYYDSFQLFDALRIPVINNSQQEPQFRPIRDTGDEGGQFIFVRK